MAQGLVTYLGGAVKPSLWLQSAANPTTSIHFFDDMMNMSNFTGATAQHGNDYPGGHATTINDANTNTTSSTPVVCKAPRQLAFALKGRHAGTKTNGIVGLASIAAGGAVTPGTTVGAYFTTDTGVMTFRVKGSGSEKTLVLGDPGTDDVEHGFVFENGKFRVYIDGEYKGEVNEPFPAGHMRVVAGKHNGAANANRLVSFDYVLVSGTR